MDFANVVGIAPPQIAHLPIGADAERLRVRPNLYQHGRMALQPAGHDVLANPQADEFGACLELLLERPGNLISIAIVNGFPFVESHGFD